MGNLFVYGEQGYNAFCTAAIFILFCGLVCIAAACYVYFVAHIIYSNSDSSRVQNLNRLLQTFGKTGTAIIFSIPGIIAAYACVKKCGVKNKLLDIKIHHYFFSCWVALAGKNITLFNFFLFQAPVYIHLHFSLKQFCLAGTTHTTFTGKG